MPARLPDEPIDHAQPEAAAGANILGGKERLEHVVFDFVGHADAGVGDGEQDILARFDF